MSEDLNTFYPEGIAVKISDREFRVKPFVLKNRTKFVRVVADLMKEFVDGEFDFKNAPKGQAFMQIIEIAGDRLIDIYELVLEGVDRDWMNNHITIPDEVEVLSAIYEVNNIPLLLGQIQKVAAQVNQIK